jgi:Ca-activated chloride channel family protein
MNQHAQLHSRHGEPVLFQGIRMAGRLQGALFEATVEQRFHNPTDQHMEVVYTFPLPYGAVLLDVGVKLGDKALTGSIVARQQAEAQYEEALTEGNAAIMLERNADGTHTLNLGNLAPHEPCVVTLRYAQTLSFEQRGLRLLIPTVLAPRYGDPLTDGGLKPHQVTENSLEVEYPFTLSIDLLGDLVRARISSPSHPIGVSLGEQAGAAKVQVTLASQAMLDRDFILNIDQLPVGSLAILAQDPVHPQQTAALISLCPQIQQEEHPAVAVKLLVDCSGSMGGDSIAAARRALQAIVGQLRSGDRFSLSRFGSTVEHRTRGLWAIKDTTRVSAQRWINDLQADLGGTEMEAALTSTFAIGHDEPSDVLLITDGEIYAIDALLSLAAHAGQRVFVVGIGSSPTEANLRENAEVSGGACDFVAPGENVEPAILRMFARLRSPRLDAIEISWSEGCTPTWHSPLPKSVFDADTVHVLAWFEQPPQGRLTLTGKQTRHEASETIAAVTLTDSIEDADTVASLVAHARLKTLADTEATELAVDYALISPQTNFLLVHERKEEEKALEMPELHAVKQMHPAGWGGAGSVCASSEPKLKLVRQCVDEIDYGEMTKRPMIARKMSAAPREADMPQEYLDIPAFLRRQADPEPSVGDQDRNYFETRVTSPEASDSLDWDNQAGGLMTPRDFLTYLNNIPQSAWPQTYAELRDLGLPPEVVDWLEEIFASEYSTPLEESIVVEVLLSALMSPEVHSRITKTEGPLKRIRRTLQQRFGKNEPFRGTPHVQPLDDLVAYMHDMEPDHWPQAMKAEAPAMIL